MVIVHGIPVVPYGTEGRGAVIAVRGLQCAVFPAKNIEVVRAAPEVEQALDALIFVFDSCTFSIHSTEANELHKPYLWSRSKCWMRARGANIQHAATKSTNMAYEVHWLRL